MKTTQAAVTLLPEPQSDVLGSGGIDSVQEAEVSLPAHELQRLWHPEYLERLARSYWRYVSRVSLGLIRVVYLPDAREVVLLSRHLRLLTFRAPEYKTDEDCGSVSWRIQRGILVARAGRDSGFLQISVRRLAPKPAAEATLHVSVQVRNFYPMLRGHGWFTRFGFWIYSQTQVRIHRLVTFGFLRSLARLDLPPSEIGVLTAEIDAGGGRGEVSADTRQGTGG